MDGSELTGKNNNPNMIVGMMGEKRPKYDYRFDGRKKYTKNYCRLDGRKNYPSMIADLIGEKITQE